MSDQPAAEPGAWIARAARLLPLLTLATFGVAMWALSTALAAHPAADIRAYLEAVPAGRVLLAVGLTAASYVLLIGYDLLAIRYVEKRVSLRAAALTSFISYAFTNSLGGGALGTAAAGSVRYRLYAAAGLSGLDITAVTAFCFVTFAIGLATVGGITLLVQPQALSALESVPEPVVRALGLILLTPVGLYVGWTLSRRRILVIGQWRLRVPTLELALAQIAIGCADLALAGGALYALMPESLGIGYAAFMGLYVVALIAGVVSHVPGGLGVFESLLIALLPNVAPPDAAGSLIAYRAIYYLLPLAIGAVLLVTIELYARRGRVAWLARTLAGPLRGIVPLATALAAIAAGTVLLISGATPTLDERLAAIRGFLPLPVMEFSHLLGSIAGVGLLLLSRALLRRIDGAFHLMLWLLGAGAAFSLLKGFDYEEAIFLCLLMALLWPARGMFYRRARLVEQPLSREWIAAIAVILIGSVWLGFFAYRNVEYASELWWQFEFTGDAPRFLRATVAVLLVTMAFAFVELMRPARPLPAPDAGTHEQLRPLVAAAPQTYAALALTGDKHILRSPRDDGFLMYGVRGRTWAAMGDPFGPADTRAELAWTFRELCDQHDGLPVFYQVDAEMLPLYIDLGLSILKFGDEARVPLETFSLEGAAFRDLRYGHRRTARDGGSFALVPRAEVPQLLPELAEVSAAWMANHRGREKGFSVGRFAPAYLAEFPCAVVRKNGSIVAFSNVWQGADKHELSVDLMRYVPGQLSGVMDYLFVELMLWGRAQGYSWFNLGMAPLSGLEARRLSPMWYRLGSFAYRAGDQFYNFQGLRKYKEKFHPQWRPKFIAYPGGLTLGPVLFDLAMLSSGGMRGLVRR